MARPQENAKTTLCGELEDSTSATLLVLPASTRLELPRRCHALTGTRLTLSRSCLESDSFAVKERDRNHFPISLFHFGKMLDIPNFACASGFNCWDGNFCRSPYGVRLANPASGCDAASSPSETGVWRITIAACLSAANSTRPPPKERVRTLRSVGESRSRHRRALGRAEKTGSRILANGSMRHLARGPSATAQSVSPQ